MGCLLWALVPTLAAASGTAQWHDFAYLGDTERLPSLRDGESTVCLDGNGTAIADMRCPAGSDCCAAQYSPTGQGCTSPQGGCCLLGPALVPPDAPGLDPSLPNCLVMGDSVSIGYERHVHDQLAGICNVQHSPWDVSNGGWCADRAASKPAFPRRAHGAPPRVPRIVSDRGRGFSGSGSSAGRGGAPTRKTSGRGFSGSGGAVKTSAPAGARRRRRASASTSCSRRPWRRPGGGTSSSSTTASITWTTRRTRSRRTRPGRRIKAGSGAAAAATWMFL